MESSGAPWSADAFDLSICGDANSYGLGCVWQSSLNLGKRVQAPAPTTCAADNVGGSCILGAVPRRMCACTLP